MNKEKIKESIFKSIKSLGMVLPTLVGIVLLISLLSQFIQPEMYLKLFRGNIILDPFIGSIIGSILAGSPITSFIIGGELLKVGVSLIAVTSFLVAWVTVGVVQLPAESILLGKKFAITRNISAFFFSIIVAIITVVVVSIL